MDQGLRYDDHSERISGHRLHYQFNYQPTVAKQLMIP